MNRDLDIKYPFISKIHSYQILLKIQKKIHACNKMDILEIKNNKRDESYRISKDKLFNFLANDQMFCNYQRFSAPGSILENRLTFK